MKKFLLGFAAITLTVLGLNVFTLSSSTYAKYNCIDGSSVDKYEECFGKEAKDRPDITQTNDLNKILGIVINVIIGIVGFLAVVMMILGGINFITSQGDTTKVTKAKHTILYGVVGLIVALLAFAIVNFVLANVFKGTPNEDDSSVEGPDGQDPDASATSKKK